MMMMMMRVGVTSLLLILGIFCSAASVRAQRQSYKVMKKEEMNLPLELMLKAHDKRQGGQVVCPRGQFPCRGGRCIHYVRVCDGNNDCGDNSDEDAYYCRNSARWRARRCARAIYDECVASMYPGVGVSSIAQMIANTHLSQTCRTVMNATGCSSRVMTSSACQFRSYHHSHPWIIELQNTVNAANTTANYICRDNFQVFAEHKDCLMRSGERELLQIADTVNRQCRPPHVSPGAIFPCGISPTSTFVGCVTNAVTQQCGQQISGHLLTLYTTVVNDANCPSRQYSKMMKKEMNSPLELMHEALASLF